MKQPIEPKKEDCCNSGCNPCVFDVYEKQMKLYKKYLECGESSSEPLVNGISQLEYTPFVLIQNRDICDLHKLLVFKNVECKRVWWNAGDHLLIKYISEAASCTRAYTPIKGELTLYDNQNCDFSIIVKTYDNGLVSNYLKNLNQGECTLWRGPYGSYELIPNTFERIIMVAQGTGIAPFISIIEKIVKNDDDMTKIVLYYCCRCEGQMPLRDELYLYKSFWNFTYKIFLSIPKIINCKYQEPIIHNKLCFEDIVALKPFSNKDQLLMCGSSQFMKHYETLLKEESLLLHSIFMF